MKYRLAVIALCLIAAAWFSHMFRYDTKVGDGGSFHESMYLIEHDRWTGKTQGCTVVDLDEYVMTRLECANITPYRL